MKSEELMDLLLAAGRDPFGYSGRAMFRRRCVAVRLDSPGDLFRLGADVASEAQKPTRPLPVPSTESLGLGLVAYWEELNWPD